MPSPWVQLPLFPTPRHPDAPATWGECRAQRGDGPCPWVACRAHLLLAVSEDGGLSLESDNRNPVRNGYSTHKRRWPKREADMLARLETMKDTCAIEVGERRSHNGREVGDILGVHRELIRRITDGALDKAREAIAHEQSFDELIEYFDAEGFYDETESMTNETKKLKQLHREHGEGLSLKEFARRIAEHEEPSKLRELARGWLARKGLR
jgi:hypothetical protein